ncbi:FtsX-like permease family protein [Nanohaloarchaea archaeon H01]|nr:FtsX-like permease family protein [Nanohaloarchaea archaeon H01]
MKLNKARFVGKLALRDIREDKKVSGIVILMLSFSFLNLVFFPAFINGLSLTFTDSIIEAQTGHVSIEAENGRLEKADSLVQKISRLEDVETVEKVIRVKATVSYEEKSTTATLVGTSANDFTGYTSKIRSGEFLRKDSSEVVVGQFLTDDSSISRVDGIGVDKGSVLRVQSENFSNKYKVRGVIGTDGGLGGLSEQIYFNYNDIEDLTGNENRADIVKVMLDDREAAEDFKYRLQRLNTQGEIKTWKEQSNLAEAINSTFGIVVNILSIVGFIVALAAIGVVIFINTSKRVREMGIVRAIGAKKERVIQIFVLEAFLFGLAGLILGNLITLGIDSYLAANPITSPVGPISTDISSQLLITRSTGMLLTSIIAGFIPAYLVSKTEIVETIENR